MSDFVDQAQARLLVATRLEQRPKIIKALGPYFEMSFVSTMREVEEVLRSELNLSFGLVICSLDFDESRMFDMLQFLRKTIRLKSLPFVAIDDRSTSLQIATNGTTKAAMKLMGAGFVQLSQIASEDEEQALLETVLISLIRTRIQQHASKRDTQFVANS